MRGFVLTAKYIIRHRICLDIGEADGIPMHLTSNNDRSKCLSNVLLLASSTCQGEDGIGCALQQQMVFYRVLGGLVLSGMEKAHRTSIDLAIRLISWLKPSMKGTLGGFQSPFFCRAIPLIPLHSRSSFHLLVYGLLDKSL